MDVLVVEDDPRIARIMERALVDVGRRVEVARNGLVGLSTAERGTHDVLVLDWMLPELDGVAVARELRRLKVRTPISTLLRRLVSGCTIAWGLTAVDRVPGGGQEAEARAACPAAGTLLEITPKQC